MRAKNLPPRFRELGLNGVHTDDGFWMAERCLADLLLERGIDTFPNDRDEMRECGLFFDDWHLYAVDSGTQWVYSLVKLREQEHDAQCGRIGDGDTPGVTVSFIAFQAEILIQCLTDPSFENRKALNREINRVVSFRGQHHDPALKVYFRKASAQGPYLIAQQYVQKIANLAENGRIPVPEAYIKKKPGSRLPRFLEENNLRAGCTVCDGKFLYIQDSAKLSQWETLAILATHTADVSFASFAAEVQYHACFLTPMARIPIPLLGHSVYDSAIRADMTIDDAELEGPAPFHRESSHWVRRQVKCHPEYEKV